MPTTGMVAAMKGRGKLRAGLLALSVGAMMATSATVGGATPDPATWMAFRDSTNRATLTSLCGVASNHGGFCRETRTAIKGRLPVRGSARVNVQTRPGAGRVKAYLVRLRANDRIAKWIDWSRKAREVDGSEGELWQFRLPKALKRANAIHLFVYYEGGGARYPGGDTVHQATYTSRVTRD